MKLCGCIVHNSTANSRTPLTEVATERQKYTHMISLLTLFRSEMLRSCTPFFFNSEYEERPLISSANLDCICCSTLFILSRSVQTQTFHSLKNKIDVLP